jgi:hypothetical protein
MLHQVASLLHAYLYVDQINYHYLVVAPQPAVIDDGNLRLRPGGIPLSNLFCVFLGVAAVLYLLYAISMYAAAIAQSRVPRQEDGKGGIFQQMNELRLRRHAKKGMRRAAVLIIAAVTIAVFK